MEHDKPNIILITTDQQRADTIRAHGAAEMWTPHLDWLVDNGISYRRAYSDCPVCMPARISIMSGEPAWLHGVRSNRYIPDTLNIDETLPALLSRRGYQTRLFGKHHHGPTTRHLMGFDAQETIEHYERSLLKRGLPHHRRHGLGGNEEVPGASIMPPSETLSAWIVERMSEFLVTRDPDKPFFSWLSFLMPHPPWDPQEPYRELYRDAPMEPAISADWAERGTAAPAWYAVTDELSMTGRLSPRQLTAARRSYAACVSEIDTQLGVLFGVLKELDLLKNTWIVFTSDHGEMLGDFGMGGKCVPFEGSSRVPMIVRPPFAPRNHAAEPRRGSVQQDLVTLTDLTATLLHLAGVEEGTNDPTGALLPGVAGGERRRSEVFGSCMYLHYLVSGDWKFCRETLTGQELLFNLRDDPRETVNRIDSGSAEELRNRMDRHLAELADREADLAARGIQPDPGVLSSGCDPPRNVHPGFRSGLIRNSGSN